MTDHIDTIAAARALIEPLTGYTPGRWQCSRADLASYDADTGAQVSYLYPGDGERVRFETDNPVEDARLAAAAPDLRDMVATLADALDAELAKVAAAHEAVANIARSHIYYDSAGSGFREDEFNDDIRALLIARL